MITVEQLRHRAALTARARTRRRPRAAPRALPPRGAVLAYTQLLGGVSAEMDAALLSALRGEGVVARADGPADGGGGPALSVLPGHLARLVARLEGAFGAIVGRASLVRALDAVGGQVDAWAGAQLARQIAAVIGIDPGTTGPDVGRQLRAFRESNLALIRTLAADRVAAVRTVLERRGIGGRVEQIAADIEAEAGATPARAALIARDQVLSLNAQVTEARHRAAGITEYVWRTSRDARVRESHRALEGRTFRYADPPVVDERTGRRENPGQDFRCRCTADPILPGI